MQEAVLQHAFLDELRKIAATNGESVPDIAELLEKDAFIGQLASKLRGLVNPFKANQAGVFSVLART